MDSPAHTNLFLMLLVIAGIMSGVADKMRDDDEGIHVVFRALQYLFVGVATVIFINP